LGLALYAYFALRGNHFSGMGKPGDYSHCLLEFFGMGFGQIIYILINIARIGAFPFCAFGD
jgi:hypothetical protein